MSESRGDDEWKCSGSFRADDDSFLIPAVEVDTTFATKPTGLVPVYVDDESSTTAVERDNGVCAVPGRDRAGVPGRGRVERAVRAPAAEGGADRAGPRLTGPARCPTDLTTGRAAVDETVLRMRRCSGRKRETAARQHSAPP